MKTLILLTAFTLAASAQGLVDATGAEWRYVATARDVDGQKFNVYARKVKADKHPTLEIKLSGDPTVIRAEHDCKRRMYRIAGGEWAKPKGKVGEWLIKFACRN